MNVLRMGISISMLTLVERSIIVILMLLANLALVRIISFDMSDVVPRQFVNRSLKRAFLRKCLCVQTSHLGDSDVVTNLF